MVRKWNFHTILLLEQKKKKCKIIVFFYFLNRRRISAANCLWSYQKMKYTFRRLQMLLQTTFTFFANSSGFRFLFFITLFCIYIFFLLVFYFLHFFTNLFFCLQNIWFLFFDFLGISALCKMIIISQTHTQIAELEIIVHLSALDIRQPR